MIRRRTAAFHADAGDASRDRHDWNAAARHYGKALAIEDHRSDLWVQYGHALKESGDLPGALRSYKASIERDPGIADTHLQLGHALKLSGRRDEAAAAYGRAAELDPTLTDPVEELRNLVRHGLALDPAIRDGILRRTWGHRSAPEIATDSDTLRDHLRTALKRLGSGADDRLVKAVSEGLVAVEALTAAAEKRRESRPQLVFDISDLVAYFRNARRPTGIQRVQVEIISALLRRPPADTEIAVCAFLEDRDDWVVVTSEAFLDLSDAENAADPTDDDRWQTALKVLDIATGLSDPFPFRQGAWLINLGTSWWLQNYFLKLRNAGRRHGIHYVPFVHDMIPVMAPEHCIPSLTRDFLSWTAGVFAHADYYLTNSNSSRRDLLAVAARLDHKVGPGDVHVVRLDAAFDQAISTVSRTGTLTRFGLEAGQFVLFVSTVESRKNHLAAFSAWRTLIDRHGVEAVPRLVCVGARGWLNDAVFDLLDSDPVLRDRIEMLSGVSDQDLAGLYEACAFTLYPSSYEGWGLPVTESLCHGKAVLTSDASSLPEAGGKFANYFRADDPADLLVQLERMILDLDRRREREAYIRDNFRPRQWREVGDEIIDRVVRWSEGEPAPSNALAAIPETRAGRWYSLRRVRETRLDPTLTTGEIFRTGHGWAAPEEWGCRTLGEGGTLEFRIADEMTGTARVVLGLRGPLSRSCAYSIYTEQEKIGEGKLGNDQVRWVDIALTALNAVDGVVRLRVREDFGAGGGPAAPDRHPSLGVIGYAIVGSAEERTAAQLGMHFTAA